MGDTANIESGGRMGKAKDFSRAASKSVIKVSKKVSKTSVGYTRLSINSIASALPDPEVMIVAIMIVTIFVRSEEAHLKRFCRNDGSVGWIMTAMGCCVVAFTKFSDTKSLFHGFAGGIVYLLIQVSLNYPPLGCLFTNVVVGGEEQEVVEYTVNTKNFAVIQAVVLVIFAIVYTVVIYRKRIGDDKVEEEE